MRVGSCGWTGLDVVEHGWGAVHEHGTLRQATVGAQTACEQVSDL